MSRQQQEQHQQQGNASSTLIDLDDAFFGAKDEEYGRQSDVTYKDQVREELLSASLATAAAAAAAAPPSGTAATVDIAIVNAVAVSASQISAEAEEGRMHDDQVREELLSASLATAAAPPSGRAAANDIPMVSDVAVSESHIAAEAEEDRLRDVERPATEAMRDQVAQLERKLALRSRSCNRHDIANTDTFDEDENDDDRLRDAERQAATVEASPRDQEVRLAEPILQLVAVDPPPPPPQQNRHINNRRDGSLDVMDNEDEENTNGMHQQRKQQVVGGNMMKAITKVEHTANESISRSCVFSPKQQQRRRRFIMAVVVAVAVLIAAGAVAGTCGTGRCSSPTTDPAVRAATDPARAGIILSYINGITLSGRTLTYPSRRSAEERTVQWLIEDDLGTDVSNKQSLQQRYVLGTLWFIEPTPTTGFGSANDYHAKSWTTHMDECMWWNVECDGNRRVTGLHLWSKYVRGQIPPDLGLLTDLTALVLWDNQIFGTIPSSLGALTALIHVSSSRNQLSGSIPSSLDTLTALDTLFLDDNQLNGTIPSSLGTLTTLTYLALAENQLTGTIPSSLGTLTALTSLGLDTNQLSGTIPSSLVALTALGSLFLFSNRLVGTMPFCNSDQTFEILEADCAEVNCTCCTGCCPVAFGNIPVSLYTCAN